MDGMGKEEDQDLEETQVIMELKESQGYQEAELSTLAGVEQPVPQSRELSYSILGELEGLVISIKVVQPTTYVYQIILTIFHMRVGYKWKVTWLAWTIGFRLCNLWHLVTITMLPVPCAMCPPEVWKS